MNFNDRIVKSYNDLFYRFKACGRVVSILFCDILNPWADGDQFSQNQDYQQMVTEPMLDESLETTPNNPINQNDTYYVPPIQPNSAESMDEAAIAITKDNDIISQNSYGVIFKESIEQQKLPTINEDN